MQTVLCHVETFTSYAIIGFGQEPDTPVSRAIGKQSPREEKLLAGFQTLPFYRGNDASVGCYLENMDVVINLYASPPQQILSLQSRIAAQILLPFQILFLTIG